MKQTFSYKRVKETKRTVVFGNDKAPIDTVYVQKSSGFADGDELTLTLEVADPKAVASA